jgi:general secretion pathway protein A
LLQIVLLGQPELDKTLSQPGFRQLRQRINLRFHLPPLSENETREYVVKRLRIAGAKEPIFTEKAIKEIYLKSGGIPRLINILCDNALLNGYALDQKVVGEKSVKEVAKDLYLKKKTRQIWILVLLSISIAVGILLFIYLLKSGHLLPLIRILSEAFSALMRG